jgi:peptide/nickel transport system permease protein
MFGVAILVFLFMRLTPGDPIDLMIGKDGNVSAAEQAALRAEFNLDKPLPAQLGIFLADAVRGDLGTSFTKHKPVTEVIAETLPATLELAIAAFFIALLIAIPIGIISAVKQNSFLDKFAMASSFLGISLPNFWLGIVLMIIFAVKLHIFPVMGRVDNDIILDHVTGFYVLDSIITGNMAALGSSLKHLFLPALTLCAEMSAIVARVTRSSMLEVLRQDYILLARSKGLRELIVVT